jgi:hypothetical protein
LHQIESITSQIFQASFNESGEIFPIVAFGHVRLQTTSGFGCHENFCFRLTQHLGDKSLAAAITINIGGVDKINPALDRGVQDSLRIHVRYIAPGTPNLPGAKTDFGDLKVRFS